MMRRLWIVLPMLFALIAAERPNAACGALWKKPGLLRRLIKPNGNPTNIRPIPPIPPR